MPVETFDAADMIVIGDVDTCVRKMKHYADLGVDELICYVQWGFLEHQDILRTIEVLGKEVIPELAAYQPKVAPPAAARHAHDPHRQLAGPRLPGPAAARRQGRRAGRRRSRASAARPRMPSSQCGARVVCVDLEKDLADEIAAEVGGIAWAGDATDRSEMERLVRDSVAALGRVDAVVDIIGMSHYGALIDIDDDEWDWHFRIVLRHAQLITQLFGRLLAESGGGRAGVRRVGLRH